MYNITVNDMNELELKKHQYLDKGYKLSESHGSYCILEKGGYGKVSYHLLLYVMGWIIFFVFGYFCLAAHYFNLMLLGFVGVLSLFGFYNIIYLILSMFESEDQVRIQLRNQRINPVKEVHHKIKPESYQQVSHDNGVGDVFCTNCGAKIPDSNSKFCNYCGAPINNTHKNSILKHEFD